MGLWNWLRGCEQWDQRAHTKPLEAEPSPGDLKFESIEQLEPLEVEITDVLDLHSFAPEEIKEVVKHYLEAAHANGLRSLRLIHGRGQGVQRKTVRALLDRDPRVVCFKDAPPEAGGWGATIVELE